MTAFYMLVAMALTFVIVLGVAFVFPAFNNAAVGSAAFDTTLLVGVLTALVHSRRSKD